MSSVDNKLKNAETSRAMGTNTTSNNGTKAEKSRPVVKKPTWNPSPTIKYEGLIKSLVGSKRPFANIKKIIDNSTPVGFRPTKHDHYIYEVDYRIDWNPSVRIDRNEPMRPLEGSKKSFPGLTSTG